MRLRHAAALALGLLAATAPARAETLHDALAHAYEHSGLLEQNRALLRAADEDVAQAVSALRAIVGWEATASARYPDIFGGVDTSVNVGLSATLLLWDGGATEIGIDAQKELVLAARADLVSVEQQVLLRAVQAYMTVRREQAFLDLRRSNVRLIEQELRAARDRFEVGEITRTDVSLAEARLAAAQSQQAAAEGALAQASAEFRAAVGRAPGALAPVDPARIDRGREAAQHFAVRNHPDLASIQRNIAAAELNVRRAERARTRPRVTGTVTGGFNQDFDDSYSLSITGQQTLYQGGLRSSQIRQIMAQRDAARAGLHVTRHAIEQNVANAYATLTVSRASIDAFDQQVRAATTAFRGIREEATLGARTTLDVLDAEQELSDARTNLVSAQIDEVLASYQVLAAMGLLTVDHLNLAVRRYDPSAYYQLVEDAPSASSRQGAALNRILGAIGGGD
ncbi:MAG: TolC family outer membrane protein [Paracoccaceae bacterium]